MYTSARGGDETLLHYGGEADLFTKRTLHARSRAQRGGKGEKLRAGSCGEVSGDKGGLICEGRESGGVEQGGDVRLFGRWGRQGGGRMVETSGEGKVELGGVEA